MLFRETLVVRSQASQGRRARDRFAKSGKRRRSAVTDVGDANQVDVDDEAAATEAMNYN